MTRSSQWNVEERSVPLQSSPHEISFYPMLLYPISFTVSECVSTPRMVLGVIVQRAGLL